MSVTKEFKHSQLRGVGYEQDGPLKRKVSRAAKQRQLYLDKKYPLPPRRKGMDDVKYLGGEKGQEQFKWQKDAYDQLKDRRFGFCVAFCGSGKTLLQIYLAAHDYFQSGFTQRQLLIMPQAIIAAGFTRHGDVEHIGLWMSEEKKRYTWRVTHNFCEKKWNGPVDKGVIQSLKKWLLSPVSVAYRRAATHASAATLSGGIAVATHQALALAWQELSEAQQKKALNKLTLRVDEAHHIKGVFDDDEEGYTAKQKEMMEEESTHLGKVCHAILNSKNRTAKLHVTTATPYRGDSGAMFSAKAREKFGKVYFSKWEEHWNNLGMNLFAIEYEEYRSTPFDAVIDWIIQEPKERHLVVVPAIGTKWRGGEAEFQQFMRKLYKVIPKEWVLDLVTKGTQEENRQKFLLEPKSLKDGPSQYRVVVTCMIGREGSDWVPCSRLHNTAVERSLTLAVQTSGRPLRRYESKTEVRIRNYVQGFAKNMSEEEKRRLFSDRTNAILVSMHWDDAAETILIPKMPKGKRGAKGKHEADGEEYETVSLHDAYGSSYPAFIKDVMEGIMCMTETSWDEVHDACLDAIEKYPPQVDVDEDALVDALMNVVTRRLIRSQPREVQEELKIKGIDISFMREKANFDKVVVQHGIDHKTWFVGEHGESDWKAIRSILADRRSLLDAFIESTKHWKGGV